MKTKKIMEVGIYRNVEKNPVTKYLRKAHIPNQASDVQESEYCAASIMEATNQQLLVVDSQYRLAFFDTKTGKRVDACIK
jgi:hypothetical protein